MKGIRNLYNAKATINCNKIQQKEEKKATVTLINQQTQNGRQQNKLTRMVGSYSVPKLPTMDIIRRPLRSRKGHN